MSVSSDSSLGLTCPQGGDFYICDKAPLQFIGCCTVDPCSDNTGVCPDDSLRVASFAADYYLAIPAQSCALPNNNETWWTCSGNDPPFLGCCSSNPCELLECPEGDLLTAQLSENEEDAQDFMNAAWPSGSPVPDSNQNGSQDSGDLSTGAIVGIAIAAVIFIMLIIGYVLYRRGGLAALKWKHKDDTHTDESKSLYNQYQNGEPSPGFPPASSPGLSSTAGRSPGLVSPWQNEHQLKPQSYGPAELEGGLQSPPLPSPYSSPQQQQHHQKLAYYDSPPTNHASWVSSENNTYSGYQSQHHLQAEELDSRHVSMNSAANSWGGAASPPPPALTVSELDGNTSSSSNHEVPISNAARAAAMELDASASAERPRPNSELPTGHK